MKQSIGFCQFHDAFRDMDRLDNFSYQGLRVLFDYLEQYEEDTGEEIELDVISLCCDYSMMSYEDIEREFRIVVDYSDALSDEDYECLRKDAVLGYLSENTFIVGEVGSDDVIFAVF